MRIEALGRGPGVRIALLFLSLLTAAVYGNSLFNGFVWDDEFIIVSDPAVRDPSGALSLMLSPDVVKPYYRPLNRASYLLDFRLFGMRPAGFHAVNVFIHLLNVLLLYLLGLRLFREGAPALLAAALFAVHPVNAEAVDFLSARNTLLSLFFVLSSILVFYEGLTRGSRIRMFFSGLLWFLGLLSKEPAALAAAALAVMVFIVPQQGENPPKRKIALLLPHLIFAGVYAALRTFVLGGAVGAGGIIPGLMSRLTENLIAIPQYLRLVLFPSNLTIWHPPSALTAGAMLWLIPVWAVLGLAAWLLLRTRSVPVFAGLFWFAFNYIPISGIVPIPSASMAERFLYFPAVGLWVIAADRGYMLYRKFPGSKSLIAGAVMLVALLGGITVHRNQDWKNDISLFASAVRTNPGSSFGHFNLGNALKDSGDSEGAQREWLETLRLDPSNSGAMSQLGSLAAVRGDLGKAERLFRSALDADPGNAMARFNLALVFEKTGRPEEAATQYDIFLRNVPLEYRDYIPRAEEHRAHLRRGDAK